MSEQQLNESFNERYIREAPFVIGRLSGILSGIISTINSPHNTKEDIKERLTFFNGRLDDLHKNFPSIMNEELLKTIKQ